MYEVAIHVDSVQKLLRYELIHTHIKTIIDKPSDKPTMEEEESVT
jgi:hypothetical protein